MGSAVFQRRLPSEFSAARQIIDFNEEIACLERLQAAIEADLAALDASKRPDDWRKAVASGRLSFGFSASEPELPSLDIAVDASVDAVCQRCLEPFKLRLKVASQLLLLGAGDSVPEQDGVEVWELDEATVRPIDIVDEALVMSMPLSARHEQCETGTVEEAVAEEITRPFADLRAQMEKDK